MPAHKLRRGRGRAGLMSSPLDASDVFSTYLYTGNGSIQTINNGIDLAGKGGLVWVKSRLNSSDHALYDTVRTPAPISVAHRLRTNTTGAQTAITDDIRGWNSNGFTINDTPLSTNGDNFVSWTFRKAPKFFDVVTYTGNGATSQTISHSLGTSPGLIIIKNIDNGNGNWMVYHRSFSSTDGVMNLNTTSAVTYLGAGAAYEFAPTSTTFNAPFGQSVNLTGTTYVAYLFAHDTSADGIIQCGSFTVDESGNIPTVTLGWEPQYLLLKASNNVDVWRIHDMQRGWDVSSAFKLLRANGIDAELNATSWVRPTATGFTQTNNPGFGSGATFIYMAIRRLNKTPTSGTDVFQPVAYTGTRQANTPMVSGITTDSIWTRFRTLSTAMDIGDRLRGQYPLSTSSTNSENTNSSRWAYDKMTGVTNLADQTGVTSYSFIDYHFRRAKGFMDVVAFTQAAFTENYTHGLGVVPEMIVVKRRNGTSDWSVYLAPIGNTKYLKLQDTGGEFTGGVWGNTTPTSTVFTFSGAGSPNTYVAYLFATLAGISKVGSYTGNGASQTINCGFSTGARFILIKRIDNTGDWYIWDTARGIVAANDPHLSLNTTAAEVTTDDSIDPESTGFIVNQNTATNINVTSATYIYLAIS